MRAQDGDPWYSFGSNGISRHYISMESDVVTESLAQPDGRTLVACRLGKVYQNNGSVVVARFDAWGEFDPGFGDQGVAEVNFCVGGDFLEDIALQPDGKIVGVGYEFEYFYSDPIYNQAVTFRLTDTGALDNSYGTGGLTFVSVGPDGPSRATGIAVLPDGNILGCGYYWPSADRDLMLFRYTVAGILDTTFGDFGIKLHPSAPITEPTDIVVQPDGKFLISGLCASNQFAVMRFHPDATVDTGFGNNGISMTSLLDGSVAKRIALLSNGAILLGGTATQTNPTSRELALVRLLPDGSPDNTFGSGGVVLHGYSSFIYDALHDMALLPDGRIVIAAELPTVPTDPDMSVACFAPSGGLVVSFGGDGLAGHNISNSHIAKSICVLPDGKVIAIGNGPSQWWASTYEDVALACYIPLPGYQVASIPEPGEAASGLSVWPNPVQASSSFTVAGPPDFQIDRIEIRGTDGRLCVQQAVPNGATSIQLSGSATMECAPGLYCLVAIGGSGAQLTSLFVVN
ncbi:MAG: hypothetical protein ABI599_04695 [Flavobacteriales bacterium]